MIFLLLLNFYARNGNCDSRHKNLSWMSQKIQSSNTFFNSPKFIFTFCQPKSLKLKLGHNLQILALVVTFGWDTLICYY